MQTAMTTDGGPKPSIADCALACRWQALDLQYEVDAAKRAGKPPEDYQTLVWQIAALQRAARMAEAISECEQQVMDTIRANRRSRPRRGGCDL